jgi:2,4-dienoyl-CoA reductase-like NADH-dependent reductase (Old Yellow Enzyme family)
LKYNLLAQESVVPTALQAEYYSQRATKGGLIISETVFIIRNADCYYRAPGIYIKEQIGKLSDITQAVHSKGGIIFAQLWHLGRIASAELNNGQQPISSSDIAIKVNSLLGTPHEKPRALTITEIKAIVQDYGQAALNAIQAGFDGVQIHAANRYLPDQFINASSNNRTDILWWIY